MSSMLPRTYEYALFRLAQQVERVDADALYRDARRDAQVVLLDQPLTRRRFQFDAREQDAMRLKLLDYLTTATATLRGQDDNIGAHILNSAINLLLPVA
jgi:hypothetical protein